MGSGAWLVKILTSHVARSGRIQETTPCFFCAARDPWLAYNQKRAMQMANVRTRPGQLSRPKRVGLSRQRLPPGGTGTVRYKEQFRPIEAHFESRCQPQADSGPPKASNPPAGPCTNGPERARSRRSRTRAAASGGRIARYGANPARASARNPGSRYWAA